MNQKLVAIAVLAALMPAAAMAEVTVYGRGHLSIDSNSGNASDTTTAGTKNGLNLTSNSSRFGVKGAEDLTNGMKGVFQFETTVDVQGGSNQSMFGGQRDTYLGVAGNFGTVIAGRLPLANQWAYDANFMADKVGDAANFTGGGFGGSGLLGVPGRVNRAIAYVSPSLGGVTVLAALVPNTQQSLGAAQDSLNKQSSFTLRGSYDSNGVFGAVSMASIGAAGIAINADTTAVGAAKMPAGKDAKITILAVAGGYDFGVGKVRGQIVQSKADSKTMEGYFINAGLTAAAAKEAKQTVIALGGQFTVNADDSVSVQFAKAQELNVGGTSVSKTGASMIAASYDHNLSKNTTVYVAFAKVSNNDLAQFSATGWGHGGVGAPGSDATGKACSPSALSVGWTRNF